MKASIKVLDLDGSGDEIAHALSVTFGIVATPDAYPVPPTLAAPARPAAIEQAPPAEIVLPHEREQDADEWRPSDGPASPMPRARFARWQDIPIDRRVFNANRLVAHVTKNPSDPYDLFCHHDVGMAKHGGAGRDGAAVCGTCNKHIEIQARP